MTRATLSSPLGLHANVVVGQGLLSDHGVMSVCAEQHGVGRFRFPDRTDARVGTLTESFHVVDHGRQWHPT